MSTASPTSTTSTPSRLPHSPTPMPKKKTRNNNTPPTSPTSSIPSLPDSQLETLHEFRHRKSSTSSRTSWGRGGGNKQNHNDHDEGVPWRGGEVREVSVSSVSTTTTTMTNDEIDDDASAWFGPVSRRVVNDERNVKGNRIQGRESRRLPRPKAFIVMRNNNNCDDGDGSRVGRMESRVGARKSQWGSAVKYSCDEVRKGPVEFVVEDQKTEMLRKCMSAKVVRREECRSMEVGRVLKMGDVRVKVEGAGKRDVVLRSDDFVEFMRVAAEKTGRKKSRKRRPGPALLFNKAHKLWRKVRSK